MHHLDALDAARATLKERSESYGEVIPSFVRAANIASSITGRRVSPFEISVVMMAVKLSRLAADHKHCDSYVDLINYTAFACQFAGPTSADFDDVIKAQVEADIATVLRAEP